ncbi:probable serine/threonine-protein kinase PBL18 [Actinidia eriantha]|uniref:probable serine/threonine-protein kinase PBL18 n=1 Tax=Actinidia eriantha TaxID=165200 RepID=UPI002589E36E|nr:probable serine/threonine-protein kinase PBL18 [Actinidia eriantha]
MEPQRVVVIQDASREVSSSAIKWALQGMSLRPGDTLTLLSVLHQVNNPMGYKIRVDTSMFGANHKIVEEEVAKKKEEYQNNEDLTQLSKLYQMKKIKFKIDVDAGPSPKVVALEAAMKLGATWVILDRQMKKDKKYYLEKLSCGISRMKRDNNVEILRGPKAKATGTNKFTRERIHTFQVTYEEMLPGSLDGDDLFSIELFPPMSGSSLGSTETTSSCFSEEKNIPSHNLREKATKQTRETVKKVTSDTIPNKHEISSIEGHGRIPAQTPIEHSGTEDMMVPLKPEESFDNSICTICTNKRATIGWRKEFTYAELQDATNGFSPENVIFEGGHGAVYRGQLKNMLTIAVKKHKDVSFHGEKKFNAEVLALGKTRHKNVVMLLGSCLEGSQRLLVYEYVCNGSLDQQLTNCEVLTWGARMTIALGVSRGLNHLHANNIIHRNITPNNILVTHDYDPLVGGFGIATQHDSDQSDHSVMGTFGYLAPEFAESGKASFKTDVYSFGVVLLELITGRTTNDKRLDGNSLLGWARPLLKQKKYVELVDSEIYHDTDQFDWTAQLAEKCFAKNPRNRPSMDKVVSILECIMERQTPWAEKKATIQHLIQ